jgi:hypothetical protein
MGAMLESVRARIAARKPGEVVGLSVREVEGLVHEFADIEAERDRWVARIKALEERLQDVVAVASGISKGGR